MAAFGPHRQASQCGFVKRARCPGEAGVSHQPRVAPAACLGERREPRRGTLSPLGPHPQPAGKDQTASPAGCCVATGGSEESIADRVLISLIPHETEGTALATREHGCLSVSSDKELPGTCCSPESKRHRCGPLTSSRFRCARMQVRPGSARHFGLAAVDACYSTLRLLRALMTALTCSAHIFEFSQISGGSRLDS